ncbi:SAM-dependent methyltransferase [Streptosporangium sp. NPDC048865]|uniref:SAM-dependent methyltransferase n=1 Tax=Streptosporangium sp. NPDC048865 TaxID=3155766 RepID=UPI00341CBD63
MSQPRLPQGVGRTALVTAYARAQETRRADRLFTDDLALRFVEAVTGPIEDGAPLPPLGPAREDHLSPLWRSLQTYFAVRTLFYDRFVLTSVEEGAEQVVIVAAGLDSRAFRLPLPAEMPVYEIDRAEVLCFKQSILDGLGVESVTRRTPVATDLLGDWRTPLLGTGFDPTRPTAWIAEGLMMYLPPEAQGELLDTVAGLSAAGSTLATESFNRTPRITDAVDHPSAEEEALTDALVGHFRAAPITDPVAWLENHGFVGRAADLADEIQTARRPAVPLFQPGRPDPLTMWLIEGHIA